MVRACWHASFADRPNGWAAAAVVGMSVGLWWAVPVIHRAVVTPGVSWVLVGGCAAAAYGCVPETGQLWEVGLVLVCGGLAEIVRWRQLPVPVVAAATSLVLWAATFGATGAPRALVGGLFAVMPVLGTAAVVSHVRPTLNERRAAIPAQSDCQTERAVFAVIALWVISALVVARTGGISRSLEPAVLSVAIAVLVATLLSATIWRRLHSAPSVA